MNFRRPIAIAKHGRRPHGPLGWVLAHIMAYETADDNAKAIDLLGVGPHDSVLDVGTGHGRALGSLASIAHEGWVFGIDDSKTMIKIACRRNKKLIRTGRVGAYLESSRKIPAADEQFDKVLCVHVLYFWGDLDPHLHEIRRVMKPGGRLMLCFCPAEDQVTVSRFPPEIYRFHKCVDVQRHVQDAGFEISRVERRDVPGDSIVWLLAERL